jgi:hypothetical protein
MPRTPPETTTTLVEALRRALPAATSALDPEPAPPADDTPPRRPGLLLSEDRANELLDIREELETSKEILLQAKALVLCALPYKRIPEPSITRRALLARGVELKVTYTSTDEGVPLPFGADRALFAWIQTRAYGDGTVSFDSLTEFFDAFGIGRGGREYQRFRERLERLQSLALTVSLETMRDTNVHKMIPLRRAFTPRDSLEVREILDAEQSPQMYLVRGEGGPSRYGFQLDPGFYDYLTKNPVPLPLPLMREFMSRPQAWDFASMLLYRSYIAREPRPISLVDLNRFLGSDDNNVRRLKTRWEAILEEIRIIYPECPAHFLPRRQGLLIIPWKAGKALK